MPILLTRTDVKPENTQFNHMHEIGGFREKHREILDDYQKEMLDYINWVLAFPGVLDRRAYPKDEHTWVTVTVFEDMEAYLAFDKATKEHPTVLKRIELGKSIGVISTRTITEEEFKS
jgi:hypothetical protein